MPMHKKVFCLQVVPALRAVYGESGDGKLAFSSPDSPRWGVSQLPTAAQSLERA